MRIYVSARSEKHSADHSLQFYEIYVCIYTGPKKGPVKGHERPNFTFSPSVQYSVIIEMTSNFFS